MQFLRWSKLFLACLMVGVLLPAAWADHVVLKNGDRVTGNIVKKDDKNLTIKTDQLGVIAIPWDQIESVVADKAINIVLQDGRQFQGTLSLAGGKVEVITSQTNISFTPADIAALRNDEEEKAYQRLLHPGWGELWTGTGTVGLTGTAGNAKTLSFTADFNASRTTNTDKTSINFSFIKASARIGNESKSTAESVRGGISYNRDADSRLFFNVFNDYEYDRFQNLDLRFVLGGGAGFHAWKNDKSSLDLLAGMAYNRSSFSTPSVRNAAEFYWGNEYSLKLTSATSLVQTYRMFNDLTELGTYRVNFDIGLSAKLLAWLSWNVSLSDRYLSDPAPGRKTNDFHYTTGLAITFAR